MKRASSLLLPLTLFGSLLTPFSVSYAENHNQPRTLEITTAETEVKITKNKVFFKL